MIEVFERHLEATELVEPPVDLVVWPEDVIDTDGAFVDDPWADVVGELAGELDAPIIVGTVEGAGPDAFRNSAVLVDASGEVIDRYDKVHRVPFGEFVPFRSLLEKVAGDALPDRDAADRRAARPTSTCPDPVGRVATPISWEIFFPDRTREGVEDGARLVLNPTNGASFTGTIVQTQQVASSQMRAIESGRWVGQVAPTGFTAVIDDDGNVLERTSVSERGGAPARGRAPRGLTIYTRWGNTIALVLAFAPHRGGLGVPAPRSIVVVTCTASRKARSWVTRSSVPSKASRAVSSCSMASRSRWLVGSSSTRQLTPWAISSASSARVRSPGDRSAPARSTWSAPSPNLASSERASLRSSPVVAMNDGSSGSSPP